MYSVLRGIAHGTPAWQPILDTTEPPKKAGPFGIFKVYIVLPLPLVKANRKQANRSALQAN